MALDPAYPAGGVEEAPDDGQQYTRGNETWDPSLAGTIISANLTLDGTEATGNFVLVATATRTLTLPLASTVSADYLLSLTNRSDKKNTKWNIITQGSDALNGGASFSITTGETQLVERTSSTTYSIVNAAIDETSVAVTTTVQNDDEIIIFDAAEGLLSSVTVEDFLASVAFDTVKFEDGSTQSTGSTPDGIGWHPSTLSIVTSQSIGGIDNQPLGMFVRPNGLDIYTCGNQTDNINQFNLSTSWDLSTFSNPGFNIPAEGDNPRALFFKTNGTTLMVIRANNTIVQFSVSTAWDINAGSENGMFSMTSLGVSGPTSWWWRPDGLRFYIKDSSNNVLEFLAATAWDINTAPTAGVTFNSGFSGGLVAFRPDGRSMYLSDSTNLYEYELPDPWDITTAELIETAPHGLTSPRAMSFKEDGTKFFVLDASDDTIYEVDLGIKISSFLLEGTSGTDSLGLTPGSVNYDLEKGTMNVRNIFTDSSIQVGQESVVFVVNNTGSTIVDGKVVNVSGYDATNDALEIVMALADKVEDTEVLGVTTTTMVDGAVGLITVFGRVNNLNTTGFTAGAIVYLSETVPGGITETRPVIPIQIGHVGEIDASTGFLQVEIKELEKSIFGGFSHLVDQTFTVNVSKAIVFNTNEEVSGIEHSESVDNSEFTFTSGGVYQATIEPQYTRTTGGGTDVLNIFLSKDAGAGFVNVIDSNVKLAVNTAGVTTVSPLTKTFRVNATDKIRFMAQAESADLILDFFAASGSAPNEIPATPSVIMNLVRIGD